MSLIPFKEEWKRRVSNPTVISWISEGAPIPFHRSPRPFHLQNRPTPKVQREFITQEIEKLLTQGTIKESQQATCISPIGVVPKKNGKMRMIVDMRMVNQHIRAPKFSMEDIRKLQPLLLAGDWMTTIDLKDGFHHVPIRENHQQFMGMQWQGKTYVWTHLMFGMSASHFLFTKTLREAVTLIRKAGIKVNVYMDDFLIMAPTNTFSKEICNQSLLLRTDNIDVFERTGWDTQTTQSNNQSHFLDPQTPQLQTHSAPPTGGGQQPGRQPLSPQPDDGMATEPGGIQGHRQQVGPSFGGSQHNHLLPRYNSRFHDPKAEATDALLQDWTKETNWINPPFRIIPLVVQKLINSPAKATLIVPYWPSAPWFTDLMKISEDTIPMSTPGTRKRRALEESKMEPTSLQDLWQEQTRDWDLETRVVLNSALSTSTLNS
jgi:hypothetical protein